MNRIMRLLVVVFIAAGCTTTSPEKGYSIIQEESRPTPIEAIIPTPQNSTVMGIGVRPDPFAWLGMSNQKQNLAVGGPTLSYEDPETKERILSLYKIYYVDFSQPGRYQLAVESLYQMGVSLVSLTKSSNNFQYFMFEPLVQVRDSMNLTLDLELVSADVLSPNTTQPLRFGKVWKFEVHEPSRLFILVYSNNNNLGRPLGGFKYHEAQGIIGPGNTYNITYHTTMKGKFFIRVELAPNEVLNP